MSVGGREMDKYIEQNKIAWEYDAYNFWVQQLGLPCELASEIVENPRAQLKKHSKYFDDVTGLKIANICGLCGKKAIPLALLGAEVTVFDISEKNKKYACEVAEAANTNINYIVGDVQQIDMSIYSEYFDIIFMEGGILHNFHDINIFMDIMNQIIKNDGRMICSDFHPLQKMVDVLGSEMTTIDYFSTEIIEDEMAHARFYDDNKRKLCPKCKYRKYNLSEIFNSVIENGFIIKQFDEHPSWTDSKIPGEFTILAQNSVLA